MIARLRRVCSLVAVTGMMLLGTAGAAPAHATGDPNDPYDSGCINQAYIANSGDVRTPSGTTFGHVENWYSWGCKKNWTLLYVSVEPSSDYAEIHTKGVSPINPPPPGSHRQCEPTNCASFYTGGRSPLWTDMIEGTDVACLVAEIDAFDPRVGYVTGATTVNPTNQGGYGGYDAICA